MERLKSDSPFWRQGDIFFVRVDDIPNLEAAKQVKNGVIARGETTGHMHRVSQASLAAGAVLYAIGRGLFLKASESGAAIVHEEHKAVNLPAGTYAVVPQREFDGLRWRQVVD